MVNILSIAEKVSGIFENLRIDESKCAKLKSGLSSCNRCIQSCPAEAIKITEKLEINSNCLQCGVCASKCPTGAIDWQDSAGNSLFERITQLSKKQETIYVQCSKQSINSSVLSLQVPCLGMLSTELWMLMLTFETKFVLVHKMEDCHKCSFSNGKDCFSNELNIAEKALGKKLLILKSALVEEKCAEQHSEIDYSKRQWFDGVFGFIRKTPKKAIYSWTEDAIDPSEKKKLDQISLMSPRKKVATYLIKSFPEIESKLSFKTPTFNERCEFCNACSLLCPNQAITQIEQNGKTEIQVDPILCSECNLCQDICYFNACQLQGARETDPASSEL